MFPVHRHYVLKPLKIHQQPQKCPIHSLWTPFDPLNPPISPLSSLNFSSLLTVVNGSLSQLPTKSLALADHNSTKSRDLTASCAQSLSAKPDLH
jgi:hypothetical protein